MERQRERRWLLLATVLFLVTLALLGTVVLSVMCVRWRCWLLPAVIALWLWLAALAIK